MGEYTDLYDENKKQTGEKIFREKGKPAIVPKDRYTIVVLAFIENSAGKYLVQKTSSRKGNLWAIPGGHVKAGQTPLEAIKEELVEEIGLEISEENIRLFKTYKYENAFKDVFYIKKDIELASLKLEKDEVEKVEFLSKDEIMELIENNNFRKTNIDSCLDVFKNKSF